MRLPWRSWNYKGVLAWCVFVLLVQWAGYLVWHNPSLPIELRNVVRVLVAVFGLFGFYVIMSAAIAMQGRENEPAKDREAE